MRIVLALLAGLLVASNGSVAKDLGFPVDGFAPRFNQVAETRGSVLRAAAPVCDPPDPADDELTCRHEIGPHLMAHVTRRDGHVMAWMILKDRVPDADGAIRREAWRLFAEAVNPSLTPDESLALADEIWTAVQSPNAAAKIERGPVEFDPISETQLFATPDFIPVAVRDARREELRSRRTDALALGCACPRWSFDVGSYDDHLRAIGIRVRRSRPRESKAEACAREMRDDPEFRQAVEAAGPTACREAERRYGPNGVIEPDLMSEDG